MVSVEERANQIWFELSCLIPIEQGDYDYQALVEGCKGIIVRGLVKPLDKTQAFDAFLAALDAAGVKDNAPIIEALYVYREALLKWQRELMDQHARDAELAISILRGYTRKEPE